MTCPLGFSASSSPSPNSGVVLAKGHPNRRYLKQQFFNQVRPLDKIINIFIGLRSLGKGFMEHKGVGCLLALPGGRYADTYPLPFLGFNTVLVTNPSVAEAILKHHRFEVGPEAIFTLSTPSQQLIAILGADSLLLTTEDKHAELRAFVKEFFEFQTVRTTSRENFETCSAELIHNWSIKNQSGTINITHDLINFSRKLIFQNIFGTELMAEELAQAIDSLVSITHKRVLGYPKFYHQTQFDNANRVIDESVETLLAQAPPHSLLIKMKNALNEEGTPRFTPSQVISMCKLLLFAGQETLGNVLIGLVYQMGRNPSYQIALHEEFLRYNGNVREFTSKSKVLVDCIEEALRLYPAVPTISRKTTKSIIVNDEYYFPKGWGIDILPAYIARDSRRWPDEPHSFNPSRSRAGNREGKLVFGGEKNHCLGHHFAYQAMKVFLAQMVAHSFWETQNPNPVDFSGKLSIKFLENIHINLVPREESAQLLERAENRVVPIAQAKSNVYQIAALVIVVYYAVILLVCAANRSSQLET